VFNGIGIIVPIDGTADWEGAFLFIAVFLVGFAFIFTLIPIVLAFLPRLFYWWLDRVMLREVNWQAAEKFRKRKILRLFMFAFFVTLACFEGSLWISVVNTFYHQMSGN
jgi:heme/copper-type cytochrome/quinol oxidase subunit 4